MKKLAADSMPEEWQWCAFGRPYVQGYELGVDLYKEKKVLGMKYFVTGEDDYAQGILDGYLDARERKEW